MPLRATCPSCSASVTAPDEAKGKIVACPKCKSKMTLPGGPNEGDYEIVADAPVRAAPKRPSRPTVQDDDDDYEDRPRAKKKKKAKSGGIPVLLIVLPIVLVLGIVGGGIVVWQFFKKAATNVVNQTINLATTGSSTITWTPFDAPDGSFSAEFPNGPPQVGMDSAGSGAVMPGIPGAPGAAGKGGNMKDMAKDMGIDFGSWMKGDPAGMYSIGYSSLPAMFSNMMNLDAMTKDLKPGKQPNGTEVLKVDDVTLGGYPGKRILTRNGPQLIDTRMTKIKGRLFTVTVAVNFELGEESANAKRFFDKFVVKNVPEPKPMNMPGMDKMPPGFEQFLKPGG